MIGQFHERKVGMSVQDHPKPLTDSKYACTSTKYPKANIFVSFKCFFRVETNFIFKMNTFSDRCEQRRHQRVLGREREVEERR
jgi:hypothetical protein